MWTGNVSPVIRQKAKGTRPKRNAERRAARRVVLAGFPISPRPFSLEEVRFYFSGDKITCLLCGKSYNRISATHLHNIHSVTEDEYRARYGLPWRRGLTSRVSHENYKEAGLKRIEEWGMIECCTPENRALSHIAKHKERQPFRRELSILNLGVAARPRTA